MTDNLLPGFDGHTGFNGNGALGGKAKGKKEGHAAEGHALDEMLRSSRLYRHSDEYLNLLDFVSRFRDYSPFNCMLVYIQNPGATYFASASDWHHRFGRYPKHDARPMVILQPFGPVMFVYDMDDTDGTQVPDDALHPFKTEGFIPALTLANIKYNCSLHHIEVREIPLGSQQAGEAMALTASNRKKYNQLELNPAARYLVLLNSNHSPEELYSSLAHELGHIFCGHQGQGQPDWWGHNRNPDKAVRELEAESVSYLLCRRQGLNASSEQYLSHLRLGKDEEIPPLGLNAVFQAVDYIEKMGAGCWKEPRRKPSKRLASVALPTTP